MKELYLVHHSKDVRRTEKANGKFEAPQSLVAEEISTISVAGGVMNRGVIISPRGIIPGGGKTDATQSRCRGGEMCFLSGFPILTHCLPLDKPQLEARLPGTWEKKFL